MNRESLMYLLQASAAAAIVGFAAGTALRGRSLHEEIETGRGYAHSWSGCNVGLGEYAVERHSRLFGEALMTRSQKMRTALIQSYACRREALGGYRDLTVEESEGRVEEVE